MKLKSFIATVVLCMGVCIFGQALKPGTITHTQGVKAAKAENSYLKVVENLNLPEQKGRWDRGPRGWHVHFGKAVEEAIKENKCLYVLSTGSDWCGFCIKLHDDVLESNKFKQFAKKNLVLVYLDFPKKKKLSDEQQEHNRKVVQALGGGGGYPTALILSPTGELIDKIIGYNIAQKADGYIKKLKDIVARQPKESVVPRGGVPGVNPTPMKPLQKKDR